MDRKSKIGEIYMDIWEEEMDEKLPGSSQEDNGFQGT